MTPRREWGALGALVLASAGLRAWAAVAVPVPWIAPDEMVYGLLGRGLYEHGSLDILGGPTPFYSFLTPLFGVLFGAALLGERITPAFLAAALAVAGGIVLVNLPERAKR